MSGLEARARKPSQVRAGQRLAIVLSRDGHEVGIVSLQDVLKAIFGEVRL